MAIHRVASGHLSVIEREKNIPNTCGSFATSMQNRCTLCQGPGPRLAFACYCCRRRGSGDGGGNGGGGGKELARSLESGAIKRPSYGVERERSGGDGAEGGKLASGWITAAAATFGSFL